MPQWGEAGAGQEWERRGLTTLTLSLVSTNCVPCPSLHHISPASNITSLTLIHKTNEKHKQTEVTHSLCRSLYTYTLTSITNISVFWCLLGGLYIENGITVLMCLAACSLLSSPTANLIEVSLYYKRWVTLSSFLPVNKVCYTRPLTGSPPPLLFSGLDGSVGNGALVA